MAIVSEGAVQGSTDRTTMDVRPCDLECYQGHRVPDRAPEIVARPTAHQRWIGLFRQHVLMGLVALIFFAVEQPLEDAGLKMLWVIVVVVAAILCLFWLHQGRVALGKAQMEELDHGYSTHAWMVGQWWVTSIFHPAAQWDWDNIWILDDEGRIIQQPKSDEEGPCPPGFYPTREGYEELWTGRMWTGYFREVS